MSVDSANHSIDDLLNIMQALRAPDTGCPWDQVQTFQTIAPYTIEEAYEVSDAIARDHMEDLCDELGDLLLQVVYHAQMAEEENQFGFDQVVNAICEKMIRRHPHVFGSEEEIRSGKQDWELHKKQERAAKGMIEEDESALANVATGFPPVIRAKKLQKKAAKVNFDWPSSSGVLSKLQEEMNELTEAVNLNNSVAIEEEIGDVLFTVVNLCRHLVVDAEISLQKANAKFEKRFRIMEKLAKDSGEILVNLNEKELNILWGQSKSIEKSTA